MGDVLPYKLEVYCRTFRQVVGVGVSETLPNFCTPKFNPCSAGNLEPTVYRPSDGKGNTGVGLIEGGLEILIEGQMRTSCASHSETQMGPQGIPRKGIGKNTMKTP